MYRYQQIRVAMVLVCLTAASVIGSPSLSFGETITTLADSTYWVGGTNFNQVLDQGTGLMTNSPAYWQVYNSGSTFNQQYVWMNIASTLSNIPANSTITAAAITFPNTSFGYWYGGPYTGTNFSIFAVPGSSSGMGFSDFDSEGMVGFYNSHTPYGLVTDGQIGQSSTYAGVVNEGVSGNVSFDITNLVKGWKNSSISNPGQMMLLASGTEWTLWTVDGLTGGPSVTVTTTPTPEPSALVLIATGFIGLLAYAWRKRR